MTRRATGLPGRGRVRQASETELPAPPAQRSTSRPPRIGALDGLRGLAVSAVIAYHLGARWLAGGYLGVDLFFVLSGFLITGLLLDEHRRRGAVALGAFWARRARRLLPALLALLLVLAGAAAAGLLVAVSGAPALRGDILSTLAYVANWHELLAGQSYFARFSAPSPLAHAWSLAIEEQFYLVWPLALVALAWVAGRRRCAVAGLVAAVATTGALASAAWMAWLSAHGASLDRLYYGTDTRAFELLAGAALAASVARRPAPGAVGRRLLGVGGLAGLATVGVLMVVASGGQGVPAPWVFRGGMALCTLGTVAVVADVRLRPSGALGRVLERAPLRFLGRISYALYLWHWPVICELTPARLATGGVALDAVRLAVTGALALASTMLLEEPVRRLGHGRAPGPVPGSLVPGRFPLARRAPVAWASASGVTLVVALTLLPFQPVAAAAGPAPAGATPPGAGDLGGQTSLAAAGIPTPSSHAPLRVTLVGDSVMWDQAPAIAAALDATGAAAVTDTAFPGWGLSTDPSWPTGVPTMLERTRPQLVIASWSWDDNWLLADPPGYRATLERFLRTLLNPPGGTPGARAVVLEQFPPLGPLPLAVDQAQRVAGVRAWNALAATMPARFPGRVAYLPLAGAVEHDGAYATWLRTSPGGPWVRVRQVDATHLCPAGAARYAAALAWDLRAEVGLPPPPSSWWTGSWDRSPAYDSPPGACPADAPGTSA